MLVVVVLVDSVAVPVVHVIHVVAVRHRDVTAPIAVGVVVRVVGGVSTRLALVVVTVVSTVQVTVVGVVDVVAVWEGDVAATVAVGVGVGVSGMFDVSSGHLIPASSDWRRMPDLPEQPPIEQYARPNG